MDDWVVVAILAFISARLWRKTSETKDEDIMTLYRQAARYTVASLQDDSEIIQMLHANYGMGYFLALRDIATDSDFRRVTGQDMNAFEHKIAVAQDVAAKRIVKERPELVPMKDDILLKAIYY